jgi:hypothetical protein
MQTNQFNYFPNQEVEVEFNAFNQLKTPEEKAAFFEKKKADFEKKTPEKKTAYHNDTKNGLEAIGKRVDELFEKVELGEVANIVSVAYIAQKYFGKTRHWLYQRINGSTVNGKPARFTPDEKKKLQEALLDISNIIKNTSLKIA